MPRSLIRFLRFAASRLLRPLGLLVLCVGGMTATATARQIPAPSGFEVLQYGELLTNVYHGSVLVADFDRRVRVDGKRDRLDVFLSGLRAPRALDPSANLPFTQVYLHETTLSRDDPGAPIQEQIAFRRSTVPFENLFYSAAAAADFDRDGDVDLLYAGATLGGPPFDPVTRLRINDGQANVRFDDFLADFADVHYGSLAWGDYDDDGDEDLLLTGTTRDDAFVTRLYRNDGGRFEEITTDLPNVGYGHAAWGDYDGDGDRDVLITGVTAPEHFISRIYRNDGNRFVEAAVALPGLAFSKAAWCDFDGDGRLDVLLSGGVFDPFIMQGRTLAFRNLADGRFQEIPVEGEGFFDGHLAVGDLDNDGDADFLVSGRQRATGQPTTALYRNDGDAFRVAFLVPETLGSAFALADFDRDDNLDIFITGFDPNAGGLTPPQTQFYLNRLPGNAPPTAPSGLQAAVAGNAVTLSWNAAADDRTPTPALSYNLRVGTAPGGIDVVAPMADAERGERWVSAPGNAGATTRRRLTLSPGTYFWSVQALDAGYAASVFAAEEGAFTIPAAVEGGTATGVEAASVPERTTLAPGYPNPFRERTLIQYVLPETARVRLAVYDVLGRRVRTLVDHEEPAGERAVAWDATDDAGGRLPSGVYLYRLELRHGPAMTQTITLIH